MTITRARGRTRPRLRDHVHVGLRVIDARDMRVYRVTQVWRADREVLLVARDDGERRRVGWSELAREFEMIQPFTGVPR